MKHSMRIIIIIISANGAEAGKINFSLIDNFLIFLLYQNKKGSEQRKFQ